MAKNEASSAGFYTTLCNTMETECSGNLAGANHCYMVTIIGNLKTDNNTPDAISDKGDWQADH